VKPIPGRFPGPLGRDGELETMASLVTKERDWWPFLTEGRTMSSLLKLKIPQTLFLKAAQWGTYATFRTCGFVQASKRIAGFPSPLFFGGIRFGS